MSKPDKISEVELPDSLKDKRRLEADEKFSFGCHKGVPCFTDCCQDINIFLTPLDVLRLSRKLGIETQAFLEAYTLTPITKDLHLPVLMLKMNEKNGSKCHFVGDEGCGVYEDRPWACRMYPLGSALPPARAGIEPKPIYFLFEDNFCEGHAEAETWTVAEYRDNQGVPEREAIEAGFQEIVSHPWFIGGRQLDSRRIEMFHMASYNLDTFRRFVFSSSFLNRFELEDELIDKLKVDDEALLQFAFKWLKFALFAEPTMKIKASKQQPGRKS
jgi:Fe-S-cluster containining protein